MKIWVNDGLQAAEGALVSVFDHGLTVGDGIFETVKAVQGRPFALTRHLDRLTRSAKGLGLPEPDHDLVRRACAAVLDDNPVALGRLRITYTGGLSPSAPYAEPTPPPLSSPPVRSRAAPTPPPPSPSPGRATNAVRWPASRPRRTRRMS